MVLEVLFEKVKLSITNQDEGVETSVISIEFMNEALEIFKFSMVTLVFWDYELIFMIVQLLNAELLIVS